MVGVNASLPLIQINNVTNHQTNVTTIFTAISNSTASLVLANMTSPRGPVGYDGVQGPTGARGRTGDTGATGMIGLVPGYVIVGSQSTTASMTGGGNNPLGFGGLCPTFNQTCGYAAPYPLTRAGVQAAINYAALNGGCVDPHVCNAFTGIVRVGGNVTSDGTTITIPSGITLDFGGNTLFMAASSTSYDLVSSVGTMSGTAIPLKFDALAGNSTLIMTPAQAATFSAGSVALLQGGTIGGAVPGAGGNSNRLAMQTVLIQSVNSVTGVVVTDDTLAYDFLVSLSATITLVTSLITNAGIQNVVLHGNGNTGATSRLLVVENARSFTMDSVAVTGTLPSTMPAGTTQDSEHQYRVAGIWVSVCVDCAFRNLRSSSFSGADNGVRDIGFSALASSTINLMRSTFCGGPGPAVLFSVYTRVRTVIVTMSSQAAFKVDTSAYCFFSGMILIGAQNTGTGHGLGFSFGSHHNTVQGLVATGNGFSGITFTGTNDGSNLINGFASVNNVNNSVVFGTVNNGATGNALYGFIDTAPGALPGTGNPFDYNVLHHVASPNGHYMQSLSHVVPTAADFVTGRELVFQVDQQGNTPDNLVTAWVLGKDSTLRSVLLTSPSQLT